MSLIELMVATSLLAVVLPAAFMFVLSASRNERVVTETTQQQHTARLALESFSRVMRKATYPQGYDYTASSIFVAAASEDVTFYSDVDQDAITERVRYRLVAGSDEVERTVVEPNCDSLPCSYSGAGTTTTTGVVWEHVRNQDPEACNTPPDDPRLFRYYTVDRGTGAQTEISGSTINDLVDISFVQITVVADITPQESPTCQTLGTGVSLRNWRG